MLQKKSLLDSLVDGLTTASDALFSNYDVFVCLTQDKMRVLDVELRLSRGTPGHSDPVDTSVGAQHQFYGHTLHVVDQMSKCLRDSDITIVLTPGGDLFNRLYMYMNDGEWRVGHGTHI